MAHVRLDFISVTTPAHPSSTDNVFEPFLLERRLLPKVWGGTALRDKLGIDFEAASFFDSDHEKVDSENVGPIGESWELFDRPDGASHLRGSELTISSLMEINSEALVGRGVKLGHNGSFPLMLKFLDAQHALSLQVHPDDNQARGDMGKNECCLILHAGDNARMVHGIIPGIDLTEIWDKWETADVEPLLYSFVPKVGDVVHIPPGTPHSIGPNVVVLEVQENSDQTYRFYDWGRGRETHAIEARDVVSLIANERPPVQRSTSLPDGGELLIVTPHFAVRRYGLEREVEFESKGRYLTLTVLDGSGRLHWKVGSDEKSLALSKCDTVVVPACVSMVRVEPDGQVDLVVCDPGTQ